MSYTIIPQVDQFNQAFLFAVDEYVYPDGRIVPRDILLNKNLHELDRMSLTNLRKIAKKLQIPGLHRMNKNVLSTQIRNYIVFE